MRRSGIDYQAFITDPQVKATRFQQSCSCSCTIYTRIFQSTTDKVAILIRAFVNYIFVVDVAKFRSVLHILDFKDLNLELSVEGNFLHMDLQQGILFQKLKYRPER